VSQNIIEIYTDGSATKENLPGGWAFRIVANESRILSERCGHMKQASNNDAELEAAVQGLIFMHENYVKANRNPLEDDIYLVSDSQLTLGWATGKYKVKQPKKLERVKTLNYLMSLMNVKTKWVRGHSGNEHNNRCDKLAKRARMGITEFEKHIGKTKKTVIGVKKKGTIALRYKEKRFVIDLENMVVEEYDRLVHGHRDIFLQVVSDEK
jgi:ribonuclease HI